MSTDQWQAVAVASQGKTHRSADRSHPGSNQLPTHGRTWITMRRTLISAGSTLTAIALSATGALAAGGVSAVATGNGKAVSAAARADYSSGQDRGAAVSALARQHGALVSAAAQAPAQAKTPAAHANRLAH